MDSPGHCARSAGAGGPHRPTDPALSLGGIHEGCSRRSCPPTGRGPPRGSLARRVVGAHRAAVDLVDAVGEALDGHVALDLQGGREQAVGLREVPAENRDLADRLRPRDVPVGPTGGCEVSDFDLRGNASVSGGRR